MRDNWWHLIAFAPIAVLVGGFVGGYIGAMLIFLTILPYPVAIWGDVKYVRATVDDEADEPSAAVWTALGVLVLVTIGLLSLLVSPVYVYLRRQWLA